MDPIGMAEMNRIFEVTDRLAISREAIQVPLLPAGEGSVRRLPGGRIEIVLPADGTLDDWLPTLERRLREIGAPDG
jgi:hypothetical protein